MVAFPDFEILQNLSRDTYVVDVSNSIYSAEGRTRAVLKHFHFNESSDWYGIDAVALEVERLKRLSHSGIISYLDVFPIEDGFGILRDYVAGSPLSPQLSLSEDAIYDVILKLLDILKYLQELEVPVFHANVKPSNVFIDADYNVYLTDFAFNYRSLSTKELIAQKYSFVSPEYWQGKSLLPSSDLYSLGLLLICWFCKISVTDIPSLYDGDRLTFEFSNPQVNDWLHQLVKPNPRYRFSSARDSLQALLNISYFKVEPLPNVFMRLGKRTYQLSFESPLPFSLASRSYGDIVTESFVVSNSRHDLQLMGEWVVAPAEQSWISIEPSRFQGNETRFCLQVDTQNLYENSTYRRHVQLLTNGEPASINLEIKVDTAKFFAKPKKWLSVGSIGLIFLAAFWLSVVEHHVLLTLVLGLPFVPLLYFEFLTFTTAIASAGTWVLGLLFSSLGVGQQVGFPLSAIASLVLLMAVSVYLLREAVAVNIPLRFPVLAAIFAVLSGFSLGLLFRSFWGGWFIFLFCLFAVFGLILFPDWQRFQRYQEYHRRLSFLIPP